jgi:hypothetical protein
MPDNSPLPTYEDAVVFIGIGGNGSYTRKNMAGSVSGELLKTRQDTTRQFIQKHWEGCFRGYNQICGLTFNHLDKQ